MSRVAEQLPDCLELARSLASQPQLFCADGSPGVELQRYTGARVTADADRCVMAGALRMLEASDREIARVLGCDVRSIPLMLREAEKLGRLPALKERLAASTGTNAERCQIVLASLLDGALDTGGVSMDRAAMIKAVATAGGITTDKHQLLTGSPTEILELRVGAGRDEAEAWCRANAIPVTSTVAQTEAQTDLESAGQARPAVGSSQESGGRHTADTRQRSGVGAEVVETKALAERAGGGSVSAAEAETPMV